MIHPRTRQLALAAAITLALSSCKAFDINVGTKEPIKLDPIKVDLTMRVDVYQYTGASKEEKQAVKNVGHAVERQRNRMAEIQTLKNSRFVGENHMGLLTIRNHPAGTHGEYVEKTVEEENADRSFLMADKANVSGVELASIRNQQWEVRTQDAYEGELIEVPGTTPGSYRWEPKKKAAKEN
jgi:hypothetical protein